MSAIIDEITVERQRQMDKEGWTPEHDDEHSNGELALAATCYAAGERVKVKRWTPRRCGCRAVGECYHNLDGGTPTWVDAWPWDDDFDKRKQHDRRRQLVIAGALIVAEIERLDRAALGCSEGGGARMSMARKINCTECWSCDWCGKQAADVEAIVTRVEAKHSMAICNECVDACSRQINDYRRRLSGQPDTAQTTAGTPASES